MNGLIHRHHVQRGVSSIPMPVSFLKRLPVYFSVNIGFLLFISAASILADMPGHDPVAYLILLVGLFTTPILFVKRLNGPHAPLVIAFVIFFVSYGMSDTLHYFLGASVADFLFGGGVMLNRDDVISQGEIAVLAGFVCLYIGYLSAGVIFKARSDKWLVNDWSTASIVILGIVFFAIGLAATWVFQVFYGDVKTAPQMDAWTGTAVVLGRMLMPVGEILLSYAYLKTRSRVLFVLVVGLIAAMMPIGIILNSKEIAVSFLAVFFLTTWLYNGKIPVKWVWAGALSVSMVFPLAYTYRNYISTRHISLSASLGNLDSHIERAFSEPTMAEASSDSAMERVVKGIDTFAARSNLKPLMELVLARVGVDVPFQEGYTLEPILYIFLPKMLLPDKPQVLVGQHFNREMHISASAYTFISTSFMGEFYWNFSWGGLIIGMYLVGMTYGAVGELATIDKTKSVARLLILVTMIYTLVVKFETGVAEEYSLFLRTVVIILILNMVFSRQSRSAI